MSQDEAAARAFQVRIRSEHNNPDVLLSEVAAVKNGPRAYKSASVVTFGDRETGEVKKVTFVVQTWGRSMSGPGYDFQHKENRWSCDNDEIRIVQGLLNGAFPETGLYQLAQQDAGVQEFVAHIDAGRVDPETVHRVVQAICNSPNLAEALARMDDASLLASIIERSRQRAGLERWRQIVEDPDSTEPDIQKVLDEEWWVFGGRYIKPSVRRQFVIGDQLDLALVRADGSLHVVEIKQANIPKLVVPHRSHHRVGNDVHEAVSQAANYLRNLDEQRAQILAQFGVDSRRASATVVIGHPMFVQGEIPDSVIADTIRTYNSHLSRIEVMTFSDLIEGAERSFALADAEAEDTENIKDTDETDSQDVKAETPEGDWWGRPWDEESDPRSEPPF